jgi:aminoglycoside/choline kinase family phosphotransferase
MITNQIETALSRLFEEWSGGRPSLVLPLAPSGSHRVYYRLSGNGKSAIGAFNNDKKENNAFLYFSKHFKSLNLPVPEIYAEDEVYNVYLQEDLGATTLYSYLLQAGDYFPDYLVQIYKKVVEKLALLQVYGAKELDFSACYPRPSFDKQSMLWDFNTFKYYFLKLLKIPFDEQALENDMHLFADYLLGTDCKHFMFRDFQARNIMVKGGEPYFIDYQGGRMGALQYDLASLLYQAKANIPEDIKKEIIQHYLNKVSEMIEVDREKFIEYFHGYVLMRSIQTFGTYGFRGLYERKEYFIKSIPFAIRNVKWIVENARFPIEIPELWKALTTIVQSKRFEPFDKIKASSSLLTLTIQSFSYAQGIPEDRTGHGGGFVFDCRSIHNPGRYEPYKKLTGKDEAVANFLQQHSNMEEFLNYVYLIVDPAIEDYIERSFTSLTVYFGCTGGQHRSVYAADRLSKHIHDKYGIKVNLRHLGLEAKKLDTN